jgi:hypothetical protein
MFGAFALLGATLACGLSDDRRPGSSAPTPVQPVIAPAPPADVWRPIRGSGWAFEIPATWQVEPASSASIVAAYSSPQSDPIAALIKLTMETTRPDATLEEFGGAMLMVRRDRNHDVLIGRREVTLAGTRWFEMEWRRAAGTAQLITRGAVVSGRTWLFECIAPPAQIEQARPLCMRALDSIRLESPL